MKQIHEFVCRIFLPLANTHFHLQVNTEEDNFLYATFRGYCKYSKYWASNAATMKGVLDAFELLHDIFVDESLHLNLSKPEFSISILFFDPLTKHSQPWNMNHHQAHSSERPLTTYPGTL